MKKLRHKFTEWYVERGYVFGYEFPGAIARWYCPWRVKPLLIFFSPSVYFRLVYGNLMVDSFNKGIERKGEKE